MTTTTPGETPTYSRPVYPNQAAANAAAMTTFDQQLRAVRRRLDYDRGLTTGDLVFLSGYKVEDVTAALRVLAYLGLAEFRHSGYCAKDVPNG